MDILLEICQRDSCVFPNKSAFKDFGLCPVYIRGFFPRVTNLRKVEKCVAILICDIHFLRFKKYFIENNTKYNFVFNLRSRKKKKKIRSSLTLTDIQYLNKIIHRIV